MPPEKITVEESFRSSLEDLKVIIERVGSFCNTVEELHELVILAVTNDAQLKLIMNVCSENGKKK